MDERAQHDECLENGRPARTRPVDVLWFVGDYASFDPRSQKVSQAIARLYRAAGVDFGILHDGERTAGNDVRRAGEEGLWTSLAEENVATLSSAHAEHGISTIVATCPHCFNTIRNEYPQFGLRGVQVIHHTQLLDRLVADGRLVPSEHHEAVEDRRGLLGLVEHLPGQGQGERDDEPRIVLELVEGTEHVERRRLARWPARVGGRRDGGTATPSRRCRT